MSNSSLISCTILSPNSRVRTAKIDTITIHHMACDLSIEVCGAGFASPNRQASSNYGIGSDGRIALYVDESRRSFCSSNLHNDNRAITIEVANDSRGPDWHVSDKALAATIDLCTDICKRNGIKRLNYTGDTSGNLTMHRWFAATGCPGPYLGSKFPYIAEEVNKRLGFVENDVDKPVDNVPDVPKKDELTVGDEIKLTSDAKYITEKEVPSWVKNKTLYVRKIYDNGNIDFSIFKSGAITGTIDRKYLVGLEESSSVNEPISSDLSVGDSVKLVSGATYYNGKSIPSWVFNRKLYVRGFQGEDVIFSIFKSGAITGVVAKKYLIKV